MPTPNLNRNPNRNPNPNPNRNSTKGNDCEAKQGSTKLSRLVKHDCINGDPEDLVHIDWFKELNLEL